MHRKNVLYYLGAGASQQAIPVLGGWKESFKELEFYLDLIRPDFSGFGSKERTALEETRAVIKSDLQFVVSGIENQHTVDTFAKKLYVMNRLEDLLRLKRVISLFVQYFQTVRSRPKDFLYHMGVPVTVVDGRWVHSPKDMRYETFLSYLFDRGRIEIPDHVRIVSWNYDTQLEGAFREYEVDPNIVAAKITRNEKQVFKVNGSVGTVFQNNDNKPLLSEDFKSQFDPSFPSDLFLLQAYSNLLRLGSDQIGIRYAWEFLDSEQLEKRIQLLHLERVEVVVIAGYSFPFFNRDIDSKILSALAEQRIDFYLQYPTQDEFLNIVDRLNGFEIPGRPFVTTTASGSRKNTFYISDISTFFVPHGV